MKEQMRRFEPESIRQPGARKNQPRSLVRRERGKRSEGTKRAWDLFLSCPLRVGPFSSSTYLDSLRMCRPEAAELKEVSPGARGRGSSDNGGGRALSDVVDADKLAASPSPLPLPPPPLPLEPTPPLLVMERRGLAVGNQRQARKIWCERAFPRYRQLSSGKKELQESEKIARRWLAPIFPLLFFRCFPSLGLPRSPCRRLAHTF